MFWNQNLTKFTMQAAPNAQSGTVRTIGTLNVGVVKMPLWGIAVLGGGLAMQADPAYIIPLGTTAGLAGISSGGVLRLAQGATAAAAFSVNAGTVRDITRISAA